MELVVPMKSVMHLPKVSRATTVIFLMKPQFQPSVKPILLANVISAYLNRFAQLSNKAFR